MDPARVPAELWLDIFELLVSPADLHSIIQTSRKFHNLAVRALHRHVIWRTPEAVVHNLPLWDASPGMEPFVHTFDLGVSSLPGGISGRIIEANGEVDDHHAYPAIFNNASNIGRLDTTLSYYNLRSKMSFASNDLHEIMFQRIMSFSNLSTLKFHSVIFFDKHFELIHALPQLRSLHLEYCVFQNFSSSRVFNHTTLPITDLTMLNLRRRIIETLDQQHVMLEENIEHALTLALARNLRSLAIDSTADVVKYIYGAWDADVRGWVVPHNLEQLYIYRKETSLEEVQLMLPGESSFPDFTLYSVLGKMPMLTTLSTFHLAPAHNIIMPVLPLLRNYAGPVDSIERLPGRPIQALGLFKCGTGSRDGVGTLANVKLMFPSSRCCRWSSRLGTMRLSMQLRHCFPVSAA
ncbi:hypothetical protein A0H81_02745 [Grifola frondosa]|uniref:F-box domain-containing protein n=1 Tax=Grifola frondosa TaxID=5627 RepID=A0A1C7ML51_GRIFR|nr:hypothetical protein A0H81_02745 [Grifola frondosa]